jgi:glycine cleavage system regulatory protein
MTLSLVLTFSCHDRPGIVNAISERIAQAGGSWLESRLARLAGEFAGIVLIRIDEARMAELERGLSGLEESGLRITLDRSAAPVAVAKRVLALTLVGQDRPGIVRDVTQALSALGANIEEFSSEIESAPFTGETMFRATARLTLAAGLGTEQVRASLERLADEIMVDLNEAEGEG